MACRAADFAGEGVGLRMLAHKAKLLVAAAVTTLVLLAFWLALPDLLARRWTQDLRALGYPQAELAIDELGWTHATGAFSLGGEDGAEGFEADFTPAGIWQGHLSRLTVRGLRLGHPLSLSGPDLPLAGPVFFQDARLSMTLPGGIGTLPLTLDAGFTPAPDGWHGEGKGILALGPTGVPVRFTANWREGALTAAGFTIDPTQGGPRLKGQGQARRLADGRWTGTLDVGATGLPDGLPDLVLKWEDGQGVVILDWNRAALFTALLDTNVQGKKNLNARLKVTDPVQFAARLGRPDPGLTGGPLQLTMSADGFMLEDLPRTVPDLTIQLDANGIGLGRGPRDNALSLGVVARRIDGTWWLAPLADQPGRLSLPTLGLEARGLQLAGTAALPLDLDLRAASLRLPWLAPSVLSAKLRGDPAAALRLEWKTAMTDGGASLSGDVDLDSIGGRLLAKLAPLDLRPGDAPRLFPGAPLPAGMSGTIAGRLSAAWTGEGVDGSADLMLQDVGLSLPGLMMAGVNGVLHFDRLSPLSMPQQRLGVGLFDPGLALTDGALGLSLPGDGLLRLAPEPFLWAGGRVTMPPTTFPLGSSSLALRLDIPATPVPAALAALGIPDLAADGVVMGSLPVTINATGVQAGPGALRATGPGRLALAGGQPPLWLNPAHNDNLALVARALADYRYSGLALSLGNPGPRLALDGANPGLYGGYPMPMNLILTPPPPAVPSSSPPFATQAITAFKARKE